MNEFVETLLDLPWHEFPIEEAKRAYDVVIIGGGGHGLAAAYNLAVHHGITNVAVLDASYIGSGNTGRNTTIIRANYGIPESVRFYQRSLDLYQQLEEETGCWIMHSTKGILWLAHTESSMRAERARALLNTACGTNTVMIDAKEAKELCPQIDVTGGGRYPILGGSYHPAGASARHDRVAWAYAQGALRKGVHIHMHTPVTGILRSGEGRVTGVETSRGRISAGQVLIAAGGSVTKIADMARVRLPVRTHPLQAFVTNGFAQELGAIVSSTELMCYISQTARGQLLTGAEFESQSTYSQQSTFTSLASVSTKIGYLLPFTRNLRILRQWTGRCDISSDFSPIMGPTGVDGLAITTGWGTWGFKAIPASGEAMANYLATGVVPDIIKPYNLDRFAADHPLADQGSAGTR